MRESALSRQTNKYGAKRTYSELCQRTFSSKLEAKRAEELRMLEMAGEIVGLIYQPKWVLSIKPKITYTADFTYVSNGKQIVEDVKGILTRDTRTKLAWLKEKTGIDVVLSGRR